MNGVDAPRSAAGRYFRKVLIGGAGALSVIVVVAVAAYGIKKFKEGR